VTHTDKLSKSQIKVLVAVYHGTDCCNEVYDYATLHHTQQRIADTMPDLVTSVDGVVSVDGDGFVKTPERYGRGFRLTLTGYEALTQYDGERFPPGYRRFK